MTNLSKIIFRRFVIMIQFTVSTVGWEAGTCRAHEKMRNASKYWMENLKRRVHTEDLDLDRLILKWILGNQGGRVWTGFIWLRIGTGVRLLWTQQRIFVFHKRPSISWLAERTVSRRTLLHGVIIVYCLRYIWQALCFRNTFHSCLQETSGCYKFTFSISDNEQDRTRDLSNSKIVH
jgi:hypothetical protein